MEQPDLSVEAAAPVAQDPGTTDHWATRWLEKFPGRKFILLIDTRKSGERTLLAIGPESDWHALLPDAQIAYIRPCNTEPFLPDGAEVVGALDGTGELIEGEFRVLEGMPLLGPVQ